MGAIGMSSRAFWGSSYRDILYVTEGYRNKMQDLARDSWQQCRVIAYYTVAPHVKPGSMGGVESFMPLPWDKKSEAKPMDDAERKRIQDRLMMNIKLLDESNKRKIWEDENWRRKKK